MKEAEDKKELIRNGWLTIRFLRHSTKGPDGNLSGKGIAEAKAYKFPAGAYSIVQIYTSNIQRSIDTGKIVGEKFGITEPFIVPILSEHPYTDEKIEELGLSGGKWLLVENASKLLAGKIAKFISNAIEDVRSNNKTQIIAISHVPPIMSFLGYTLAYTKGRTAIDEEIKSELFKSFGGFVKPLEGFEIIYDTNSKDFLSVIFANHNLQIPTSFLGSLMAYQERVPLSLSEENLKVDAVTPTEYRQALEDLRHFLELDVSKIQTLEQLLDSVFPVDHALRAALVAKGQIKTVTFANRERTGYVIDKVVNETERVYISSDRLSTSIGGSGVSGEPPNHFFISIPSGTNFRLRVNPYGNVLEVFAMDSREGQKASYWPIQEPSDCQVLQGYAKILQEAIRDVVSVLPNPSSSPPIISEE